MVVVLEEQALTVMTPHLAANSCQAALCGHYTLCDPPSCTQRQKMFTKMKKGEEEEKGK
jgi:hypothetical protein